MWLCQNRQAAFCNKAKASWRSRLRNDPQIVFKTYSEIGIMPYNKRPFVFCEQELKVFLSCASIHGLVWYHRVYAKRASVGTTQRPDHRYNLQKGCFFKCWLYELP